MNAEDRDWLNSEREQTFGALLLGRVLNLALFRSKECWGRVVVGRERSRWCPLKLAARS